MDIELKNESCSAKIVSFGAELKSLRVNGKELMWSADPKFWPKTSPLLFPMIGTLRGGVTLIDGKEYGITKHGFARDLELTPESVNATGALLTLKQSDYTKAMYPFDFTFSIRYTLKADGITITQKVRNDGDKDMPFCLGGHPAFQLYGEMTDYRLEFPKPETAEIPLYDTSKGVYVNEKRTELLKDECVLPLKHELFYNDVVYFEHPVSRSVTLLDKDNKGLRVDFPDFTSLGVWQAKDAPFLCIEPWCGSADYDDYSGIFAEKQGIETLSPGEEKAYTYAVSAVGK